MTDITFPIVLSRKMTDRLRHRIAKDNHDSMDHIDLYRVDLVPNSEKSIRLRGGQSLMSGMVSPIDMFVSVETFYKMLGGKS